MIQPSLSHLPATSKKRRHSAAATTSRGILGQSRRPIARERLTCVLKHQAILVVRNTDAEYQRFLKPDERVSQSAVDALPWAEGNWFRPIHNRIVPLAMAIICRMHNLPRNFVHPAIWHDVGYTTLTVPSTDKGLTWASIEMREAHMARGAVLFEEFARGPGKGLIDEKSIIRFRDFIAVHDKPYIGGRIKEMDQPLRDADRVFVPSLFSFYKDYISYAAKAAEEGYAHSVEDHFIRRLQNFYHRDEIPPRIQRMCPKLIEKRFGEVDRDLIDKRFEPPKTGAGKNMIEAMLIARAQELKFLNTCTTLAEFGAYIGKRGDAEFRTLIKLARKKPTKRD